MQKKFSNGNRHETWMRVVFVTETIVVAVLTAFVSPVLGAISFAIWGTINYLFARRYFERQSFGARLNCHLRCCLFASAIWELAFLAVNYKHVFGSIRHPVFDKELFGISLKLAGILLAYSFIQRVAVFFIVSKLDGKTK